MFRPRRMAARSLLERARLTAHVLLDALFRRDLPTRRASRRSNDATRRTRQDAPLGASRFRLLLAVFRSGPTAPRRHTSTIASMAYQSDLSAREAVGRAEPTRSMVVIDTHLARGASNGGRTFHDRGGPYAV